MLGPAATPGLTSVTPSGCQGSGLTREELAGDLGSALLPVPQAFFPPPSQPLASGEEAPSSTWDEVGGAGLGVDHRDSRHGLRGN